MSPIPESVTDSSKSPFDGRDDSLGSSKVGSAVSCQRDQNSHEEGEAVVKPIRWESPGFGVNRRLQRLRHERANTIPDKESLAGESTKAMLVLPSDEKQSVSSPFNKIVVSCLVFRLQMFDFA
jgi:hypothetical protein